MPTEGQRRGVQVMNLFMQRCSLLAFDDFYRKIGPHPKDEQNLQALLACCLDRPGVQVMSCAAFRQAWPAGRVPHIKADPVPGVTANRHIARLGINKVRSLIVDKVTRRLRPQPSLSGESAEVAGIHDTDATRGTT